MDAPKVSLTVHSSCSATTMAPQSAPRWASHLDWRWGIRRTSHIQCHMNTGSFQRGPGFPHPYSQCARTPYSQVWYGASTEPSSCCDSKDCPGRCWTSLGSMIAGAGAAVADHCDDRECCCCRHIHHHRHPQRSVNARYPQRDRDRRRKVQRYCWCREADMCWTIDHFRQRRTNRTAHRRLRRQFHSYEGSATSMPPPHPVQSQ